MASQCEEWKECMNRSTDTVWSAKLTATVLGETINAFFEHIKLRNFFFGLFFMIGLIAGSNLIVRITRGQLIENEKKKSF